MGQSLTHSDQIELYDKRQNLNFCSSLWCNKPENQNESRFCDGKDPANKKMKPVFLIISLQLTVEITTSQILS